MDRILIYNFQVFECNKYLRDHLGRKTNSFSGSLWELLKVSKLYLVRK